MPIQVKLKGTTVTVHPMDFDVTQTGNQQVQWQPHDNSDEFDFDTPAITFDDSSAPFSNLSTNGDNASATDNVTDTADFTYHVHLIDSSGNKITYPPTTSAAPSVSVSANKAGGGDRAMNMLGTGTDPTIKNRPN
jgi:hypothetical protein